MALAIVRNAHLRRLKPVLCTGVFSVNNGLLSAGTIKVPRCSAMSAPEQMQEFWKKQEMLQRPLSPHLKIYKMELPMINSLIHRGSGIAMYGGVVILAVTVTALPMDFVTAVESLRALAVPGVAWWAAKTTCCFPLIYHYINGIRHLLWDAAIGFDLKTIHKTGYSVIAASLIIAAIVGAQ